MSVLMGYRKELVKDTRWGLLYVIMGSSQGTPDPLSPILAFFCLTHGKRVKGGECPKCSRHRHRHREPTTREPSRLSLPVCGNPVLKHFLHSWPSLASSPLPVAMLTGALSPHGDYLHCCAFFSGI